LLAAQWLHNAANLAAQLHKTEHKGIDVSTALPYNKSKLGKPTEPAQKEIAQWHFNRQKSWAG
jgi:hypothetical protein